MSIESLREDLARLARDVRELSKDGARLVDDVSSNARPFEEEVVAAEFIATEETIENVSGLLAVLSEIGEIHSEQVKIFFNDHRDTLKGLVRSRSPTDLVRLGFEHWNRRASHLTEGLTKTVEVLAKEGRHLSTSIIEMWGPFVELVRGDWARR